MKVIKIEGKDELIRTVVQNRIATNYIETTLSNLVQQFGILVQFLSDDGSLSDENIRRLCGFPGCATDVEINDNKELDNFNPANHIHKQY